MLKIAKSLLLSVLFSTCVWADQLTIKDDAPSQYVVQKGDTLWDISGLYLNSPWRWPELWGKNPQIDNPHLIYPGDILRLVYGDDGQPRLVIANDDNIVKLSPTKRTTIKRYQPIETLPLSVITPYLNYERILADSDFEAAATIYGGNTNTINKVAGDLIYAKGELNGDEMYGIYKKSREFSGDDDDNKIYELELVGTARVFDVADTSDSTHKVRVLSSRASVKQGQRLIPLLTDKSLPANYALTKPKRSIAANMLASSGNHTEVAKYSVVVIDVGSDDGVVAGNVLNIFGKSPEVLLQDGKPVFKEDASKFNRILDNFATEDEKIAMPNENIGSLVLFKVYDKVSYAIITDTTSTVRLKDKVGTPQ